MERLSPVSQHWGRGKDGKGPPTTCLTERLRTNLPFVNVFLFSGGVVRREAKRGWEGEEKQRRRRAGPEGVMNVVIVEWSEALIPPLGRIEELEDFPELCFTRL